MRIRPAGDVTLKHEDYRDIMYSPTQCPVCGSTDIQQVLRKAALSLSLGSETDRISGVMAYRCPKGHIFLTVPSVNQAQRMECSA